MIFSTRLWGFVLALAAFGAVPARSQPAETYFHTAANQFIGGDNASALASVNAGLERAPNDARLIRLKEEIEKKQEEQQKQDQEQQDGEQQDQQDQNGENQQEQDGQNQQQGENGQPPEQQDPGEQGDEPQNPDEQQPGDAPEQEPGDSDREQEARPQPDPSKLSRAEAERILQALGNEEETLLRRVARPQSRARRVEKDW